jgi:hypothetical protein
MKYISQIELNLPVKKVIELFDNPDNLEKWQPGLIKHEHLSGTPGCEGAKTKLKFKVGKREIEMTETIIKKDLPTEFTGSYEAKGVYNVVKNSFVELGPFKTQWKTENEFKFKGFMSLFGLIIPGAFKKQTYQYMEQFKAFAENNVSK